ncbi:lipopolysaccharide biosynthesis protein [Sphingomonas sp.]|uniref:lipopolysaccharide biosynthesis protein n=1 Tax=Sphingomonas sp. TaxID=28214 RepID=UPI001DD1DA79|nr:lipopolysaccharide biosynthesis protein [Sphingomonas sp.]MBX9797642.1 lipopolysaccharide biosynthesis protein [Sphingomonas sp.]
MDAQTESSRLAQESLRTQVRSAVLWRSGSQIFAQLIQWASTFMVIRILAPSDYGLFAMTQVVILLLNMLNGAGLASALIREPDLSEQKIRQMFGMLLLVNGVLAAIQFTLAPIAAAYYRQPMIETLLHVQCLIYATTPFIALPYALLSRGMEYRAQAKADVLSSVAGALAALAGALAGWGVWTLVWAPIILFAVRGAGLMMTARAWIWPSFDFRGAGHMARYGGLMAAGQIFWFAESQADVFIAGRQFDPHLLGIYTTSLFLAQIFVSKVIPPLNQVAFAAYARLQEDEGAVGRAFVRGVGIIMAAALPFYAGMAATAEPLVLAALGEQWAEAVPVVRILAFAMPFMTFQTLIAPACDAIGRPGLSVRNGATGGVLLVAAYLVGVNWGIQGLALSWLSAYPLYIAISLRRTLPVLGVPFAAVAGAISAPLAAALAMGLAVAAAAHALPVMTPWAQLGVLVPLGGTIYLTFLWIFARDVLSQLIETLRRQPVAV